MSPEARNSFDAFVKRAEQGDPVAQYRFSALLETGFDSIPADSLRSVELLRSSAKAGYAPAQNYLGYLFQTGRYVDQNPDSALYYLRLAADHDDPKALNNLAFLLFDKNKENDSFDSAEALFFLNKAVDHNLPQAQTFMADIIVEGKYLPKDTAKAVDLYERAISQGFEDAQLKLLNLIGPDIDTQDSEQSFDTALKYWNLGAPVIAVEYLNNVSADSPLAPRAYALLGHAYSRGIGVQYDHQRANELFAKAALLGNPSAQFIFAETLDIFPDILKDLLPDLQYDIDSLPSAEELRKAAGEAGIFNARQAVKALTEF